MIIGGAAIAGSSILFIPSAPPSGEQPTNSIKKVAEEEQAAPGPGEGCQLNAGPCMFNFTIPKPAFQPTYGIPNGSNTNATSPTESYTGIFHFNPNSLPDNVKAANELDIVKAFVQRFPDARVSVEDQRLCMTQIQCDVFHGVTYSYRLTVNPDLTKYWTLWVMVDENNQLVRKDFSCGESVKGSAMPNSYPSDTPQQIWSGCL